MVLGGTFGCQWVLVRGRYTILILNVYISFSFSDKLQLLDSINLIIEQYGKACICVSGNFNSNKCSNERVGRGISIDYRDIRAFDNFIINRCLLDLPLA